MSTKTLKLTERQTEALRTLLSITLDAGEAPEEDKPRLEEILAKIDAPSRSDLAKMDRGARESRVYTAEQRAADRIDGYDRDDLGESGDF